MIDEPLIVCVDVDYRGSTAVAGGLWFRGWSAGAAELEEVALCHDIAEYQPGEFYRREMPCLLKVLAQGPQPSVVVVDGYVSLGDGRPGLGAHLFEALGEKTPVVGVAKTRFHSATEAVPVCRGTSRAPLYVTAAGIEASVAADWIAGMHGPYRVPTVLKRVDQLVRTSKVDDVIGERPA
jgi:deoxyribonuclease V